MSTETAKEWRRHAEYYRRFGFNLVPLGKDKRPVITGVNQYTGKAIHYGWDDWQTTKQNDRLWAEIRKPPWWVDVAGLGGICGPVSNNLVCIDFDDTTPGITAELLSMLELPADYRWTVTTPGNGMHVWLRSPRLEIETGKLKLPATDGSGGEIELRWIGHYAALPFSEHPESENLYMWTYGEPSDLPAGVMPDRLLAAYRTITIQEAPKTAQNGLESARVNGYTDGAISFNGGVAVGTAAASTIAPTYAIRAYDEELDKVRNAANGTRNDTTNSAAFSLGQLVGAGLLDEYQVEQGLIGAAVQVGLTESEASAAVRSGLRAGMAKPRQVQVQVHMNGNGASPQGGGAYAYGFILDCPDAADLDEAPSSLTGFDALKYRAEDGGILDAWRDLYAEQWLYVTGQEHWYAWTGKQWRKDEAQACQQQIQELLDEMNRQASDAARDAKKSKATAKRAGNDDALLEAALLGEAAGALVGASKRTRARVESVAGMAQAWRSAPAATMDAANLLNLSNGTLDLDTLEFREHRPSDRLTFYLDYAFDAAAECPRFLQFLGEVLVLPDSLQADPEMAMLVQEFFGYSLSNDTRHESMLWLAGEGANGKTVLITVLRSLLGPLATNVNFETLGQMGNYDLADLLGKRVALSTEAGSRRGTIAEDMIKKLVSGETIKARPIYGFPFEYRSTVKLVWAMNDKPTVTDTSKAFWRRLALVPFYRSFDGDPNKDPFLIDKLLAERSGILNWALDGLSRLRILGRFTVPRAVAAAVAEYKREANPVAQWLDECTEAGGLTLASVVYSSYADWARSNGRQVLNSTNFGKELHRLNVQKSRNNAGNVYGLSLKNGTAAAPTAEDSAEIGL